MYLRLLGKAICSTLDWMSDFSEPSPGGLGWS
jgi:hypothetical protein